MATLIWKVSPYDQEVHGFRDLGPHISQAICEHTVPTDQLVDPTHQTRCMRCLLFHGDELADKTSHRDRWAS